MTSRKNTPAKLCHPPMKIRVKRIAPLQAGKMLAGIYALLSLIAIPIMLIAAFTNSAGIPLGMAIAMPLLYIAIGFVGGIIGAAFYNIVAGWLGGFEIDYEQ
jgi:hypothetical protein